MDANTFDERFHSLRNSPLFAGLQEKSLRSLAASSVVKLVQREPVIFLQGQRAGAVMVVVSGLVQRRYLPDYHIAADLAGDLTADDRTRSASAEVVADRLRRQRHRDVQAASEGGVRAADGERWLHLWAHGPRGLGTAGGDDADRRIDDLYANLVADTDLLPLLAGAVHPSPYSSSAIAIGPARVIAIERRSFATCVAEEAGLRERLGLLIEARFRLLLQAMGDFPLLRDHSHVRLARMLQDLFDAAGPKAPIGPLSVLDMTAMLGLSRKQVTDDFAFLKAFGAVVAKGEKRLVRPENGRLALVAEFVPAAEKRGPLPDAADEKGGWAELWLQQIDEILDRQGNAMLARLVAEKAVRHHPASRRIAHRHVLACLRDGALNEAGRLLQSTYGFAADDAEEDYAALSARLTKGLFFQTRDREKAQALARRSAEQYGAIYRRRPRLNFYTGINEAAMKLCAGRTGEAGRIAADILAALARLKDPGYWQLATKAEALGILGDFAGAAQALRAARDHEGAVIGTLTSTFTQFRRLGETTGIPGWQDLLKLIDLPPVVFFEDTGAPGGGGAAFGEIDALAPEVIYMAVPTTGVALDLARSVLAMGRKLCCVLPAPVARHDWQGLKSADGKPAATVLSSRNKLFHALCIGTGADDHDAAADWLRQCKRTALGLALAAAGEHERPLYLARAGKVVRVTKTGDGWSVSLPDWAAPDRISAGYVPIVRIESRIPAVAKLIARSAVPLSSGRESFDHGCVFRFPDPLSAVSSAVLLREMHEDGEAGVSVLCDLRPVAERHAGLEVSTGQPTVPPGDIKASSAFTAELAILNRSSAFSVVSSISAGSIGIERNVLRTILTTT